MFVRNRQAVFFTLFIPIVLMTIFGLIGFDKVPKTAIGLVTDAPTAATQQFLDQLKQVEAFDISVGNEAVERAALQKGDRAVVMVVPDDLMPEPTAPGGTKSARQGVPQPKTVTLLTNIAQSQQAGAAIQIISQFLDKTTLAAAQAPQLFDLKVEQVNAKQQKYIDFLLPGIVAMSIMQMAVFSVAFVFVEYKEKGILKRLLATPMKPYQFVTANVITRLLVALAQASILIALGVWVFQSHLYGNIFLLLLIAILGGIMFLGLGFIISGIAKTEESVPALANIIVFPMLFLSGVFFPTTAMPSWLQHAVTYLPLSPFAHAMREVMANGASIAAVANDLYWMVAWAVILIILAVVTFRFEERRV